MNDANLPITRTGTLNASGAAETHRHVSVVDNHRNGAAPITEAEHALELGRTFLDVDVFEVDMPPLVLVTGGLRIGSSVLAEDENHPPILPHS